MKTSHETLAFGVPGPKELEKFAVGQPMRRLEDHRFLTGKGNYVDDQTGDFVHAVFVRSIHAHADIGGIDVSEAQSSKGVIAVFTGGDWVKAGLRRLPVRPSIKNADGSEIADPPRPGLAVERVRHVGECVAMVVAQSVREAEDAAEKIRIDYRPLPGIADTSAALNSATVTIWPDHAKGNLGFTWNVGDESKTAQALATADHVVRLKLVNNRLIPNSMETRGVVVHYDKASGKLILSGSIQNPFGFQSFLCELFAWNKDKLRCKADDVGGGFGCKNQLQPEHAMLVFASEKLKRSIKWINDRTGSFMSDAHARDLVTEVQLGLDKAGRFVALDVQTIANLGAYLSTNGALIPTLPTAAVLGGAYDIATISMSVRAVFTNTVPVDAYRGAGRPEAIYLLERTIDVASQAVGISSVKLRQKNLIKPSQMPYKTALGRVIDVGNFPTVLSRALELARSDEFKARAKEARKRNARRGLGVAFYLEATLGPPADSAKIEFSADGRATLSVGTQSNGQGHETTFAQIAASQFGIAPDQIAFRQADTDATPEGGGHGGSRSLQLGGTAVLLAARTIIEKGKHIAAHLLEVGEVDLDYKPGVYSVTGTDRHVSFTDVVAAAHDPKRLPSGAKPGLAATERYEREGFNYPNGCHVCEVEVELASGATKIVNYSVVDDFGRIVNPLIVRGQVIGGIVQGIGQALFERTHYDDEAQLVTASFMDYCLPRAENLPPINLEFYEDAPTNTNPLGAKGCGEAGATGSPPAVVNAVVDALSEFSIQHLDMPLAQEKVWHAIKNGTASAK